KLYNKVLIIAIAIVSALTATAQTSMTAYSKYGYGILMDNVTSAQRAMGGIGYAMSDGRQINVMNPASYASIDSLTFLWDFGLSLTGLEATENDTTGQMLGASLDYITMQFPITKYMGASIGLVPYSSVGYAYTADIDNGIEGQLGGGGINELYVGFSGRVYKGLSLGFNFSYMFGNVVNDLFAYTNSGSTSMYEQQLRVRDWNLKAGLQYTMNFGSKHKTTLGLVYSPAKSLHGESLALYYDMTSDESADTIAVVDLKGNNSLPNTFGGGISYTYDQRFMVEADVTYQNWSDATYSEIEGYDFGASFVDRWKYSFGGELIPKKRGKYYEVIRYRFGAFYTQDYINIGGNNIREYGASLGFGLPTPSDKTIINLGFEYKRRETEPTLLIKEDYFTITVGVNFNELWFWQSKLN
ncbi:MAG: hypothetical protein R3Y22_01995, partial [Bacteroidales bacterium]